MELSVNFRLEAPKVRKGNSQQATEGKAGEEPASEQGE